MEPNHLWSQLGPLLVITAYVIGGLIIFIPLSRYRPRDAEIETRHSSIILNKWIREFWMWITAPIYNFFVWTKVSPNAISIMGTVVAGFSAVAFVYDQIGYGGWLMVLGASFDFFDGRIARSTGRETKSGSFLDSSLDRISEGLTVSGIGYMYRDHPLYWVAMAIFIGSMLTSYTKAKGETMGIDFGGGMMQRPERIAYMGAGAILTPLFAYSLLGVVGDRFHTFLDLEKFLYGLPLLFVAILCNATGITRIRGIMRALDEREKGRKS